MIRPGARGPGLFARLLVVVATVALGTAAAQFAGDVVPEFELRDVGGVLVSSADLGGSFWVLNLWASWCPPCREELPLLARAEEELAAAGLRVLLVNVGEGADVARAFLEREGLALRTLADPVVRESGLEPTNDLLRRFRSRGLPTSYFIGADRVIRSVVVGELTPDVLSQRLAELGLDWRP